MPHTFLPHTDLLIILPYTYLLMLCFFFSQSALATSWAQSAVSVFPEMTVCASVPQDSASVCLMSLDSPVITVHQTTGTLLVATDVNPAIVTPTMPTHQPATRYLSLSQSVNNNNVDHILLLRVLVVV